MLVFQLKDTSVGLGSAAAETSICTDEFLRLNCGQAASACVATGLWSNRYRKARCARFLLAGSGALSSPMHPGCDQIYVVLRLRLLV